MKVKLTISLFYFIVLCPYSLAYVLSRAPDGGFIKWGKGIQNLNIYANSSNGKGFSDIDVFSLLSQSVQEWNNNSALKISVITTNDGNKNNRNDLYFSKNSLYFNSSSVLGVTQVVFKEKTGEILEADIIINDNVGYNLSLLSDLYLGNIVTHEIGHFLGLGHSQVKNSTMFHSVSLGQSILAEDDKSAVFTHYPVGIKGTITGQIIGGGKKIGIFGAHVQAISTLTGKIEGATLSEETGKFSIRGLPLDDTFYIYVEPSEKKSSLPEIYSSSQNNFCNNGNSFRGSFFQSCYSSDIGFPTGIELTTSYPTKNVGSVTIRCSLDVPPLYFINKSNNVQTNFTLGTNLANRGQAIVGFFTVTDILNSNRDEFLLDYTNFQLAETNLYLDIKLSGHKFGTQYMEHIINGEKNYTKIDIGLEVNGTPASPFTDVDGVVQYDREFRIPLDASISNNNFFLEIIPNKLGIPTPSSFFLKEFKESLIFYFMTVAIVKKEVDGSFSLFGNKKYINYPDNSTCPAAESSYFVPANKTSSANAVKFSEISRDDDNPINCATIDTNNRGDGSGLISFVLGFLAIFMLKNQKKIKYFLD